ncbi:hypothetical protein H8D04_00090 [bacterium]|nr:hypothetical protein [bacterium]
MSKIDFNIVDISDHPDKYDIDLIANLQNGDVRYIEAEYSLSWKQHNFPYGMFNVPSRKRKFFEKYPNSLYVMVNYNKTMMAIVSGDSILQQPLVEISNRFNKSGQYFYRMTLDTVRFEELI